VEQRSVTDRASAIPARSEASVPPARRGRRARTLRRAALLVGVFGAAALAIATVWLHGRGVHDLASLRAAVTVSRAKLAERLADRLGWTERGRAQAAMRDRPDDPWPAPRGHVVLAFPGSPEPDKSYVEPGGSFSPTVGSFGVSVWALDAAGEPLATSDTLAPGDARQALHVRDVGPPAIETITPRYRVAVELLAPGRWQLTLRPGAEPTPGLAFAVRAIGPAGGPVTALAVDGERLLVNRRWRLTAQPALRLDFLGIEGTPGWRRPVAAPPTEARDPDGWAHARVRADAAGLTLVLDDLEAHPAASPLGTMPVRAAVQLALPDARHQAALDAGIAHLLMGTVGSDTRPGEPTNYPLGWLRDGAAIVVALVRAGRLDAARALLDGLAARDFFGGFGAEGDAPGLAIWALEEVARAAADPALDRMLWPHVARKAAIILELAQATTPQRARFAGPLVPESRRPLDSGAASDVNLVAQPARDGLIIGRMDWHFPALYATAAAYRGLADAAALARRLGHADDAARWRDAAQALRAAWQRGLGSSEAADERTLINALWPTFVGAAPAPVRALLEADWRAHRTADGGYRVRPLWTYFEQAKAHQWVILGEPERAHATLEWFWRRSTSPGLYVLWEGSGEDNSFGRWADVRGWIDPPNVSPHYWAAAEMVSAQLALFAFAVPDEAGDAAVIAAGVPSDWFAQPLRVDGIGTRLGTSGWTWDGHTVSASFRDCPAELRVGAGVPADAAVRIAAPAGCAASVRRLRAQQPAVGDTP
jgi:hypothetical protein